VLPHGIQLTPEINNPKSQGLFTDILHLLAKKAGSVTQELIKHYPKHNTNTFGNKGELIHNFVYMKA
jgi:hypothetical protein